MLKDIKYKGINTASNPYDATAGQLAVAHNVINEQGYIEPLASPTEVLRFDEHQLSGCKCIFKHEMLNGTVNYIFYRPAGDFNNDFNDDFHISPTATLKFLNANANVGVAANEVTWKNDSPVKESITTSSNLYEITAVGNTLCVLTAAGMDYFVWRNNTYKELGTELPFADIEFGIELSNDSQGFISSFIYDCTDPFDSSDPNKKRVPGRTSEQKQKVREGIETALVKVRESATSSGKFAEPFLVRYALRLYDGTYTHHSNPVLIQPCGKSGIPFWYDNITSFSGQDTGIHLNVDSKSAILKMQSLTNAEVFSDWVDVVVGIDIFISQPIPYKDYSNITNYDSGNKYRDTEGHPDPTDRGYYAMAKYTELKPIYHPFPYDNISDTSTDKYGYVKFKEVWPGAMNEGLTPWSGASCFCSFFSFADTEETPDSISLFYNIKEISILNLDNYTTGMVNLNITPDILQNLATRPVLPDDYKSHDQIIPHGAYSYNQRINLFAVERRSWERLKPSTLLQHWDDGEACYARLYITINDELGEYVLDPGIQIIGFYKDVIEHIKYLYVPYINAIKAEIYIEYESDDSSDSSSDDSSDSSSSSSGDDIIRKKVVVNLRKHAFLNGAVYFDGWDDAEIEDFEVYPDSSKVVYPEANKVYTSEVGNPFYFPIGGINTVGTGKIVALSSNVRAISQGQFGEFPLYVFTESGIWMLEVDDKGLYKAKQPMSLDVIESGSKVTSVDNAVAYVIERGLMLVSGAETKCISEELDNVREGLPTALGGSAPTVDWSEFKKGAICAYDNVHRRLHVYNPQYKYHYVYSVRTGFWTTEEDNLNLLSTISGSLINTEEGLFDVTKEAGETTVRTQTILTRPISFETDAYKRIRDNIQRGDIDALKDTTGKNISVLLQGSDDLKIWHDIGAVTKHYRMLRRSGTPYKWFRWMLVIVSNAKDYKLHGLTADVGVTGNNRLR